MKRTLSLISILFLAFIWPAYAYSVENSFPEAEKPSPLEASHSGPVAGMQESFREVFNLYKDSVVFISTEKEVEVRHPFQNDPFFKRFFDGSPAPGKQQQKGLGTGFVLSSDGYICTNHHVVANMDSVKVVLDGKEYDAKILGSDELTDIALLKIDGARGLKPVHLGDSDNVQVGDWAIAIGIRSRIHQCPNGNGPISWAMPRQCKRQWHNANAPNANGPMPLPTQVDW